MAQRLNKYLLILTLFICCAFFSVKSKLDLASDVAKTQINLLKKEGAILVRLKTNSNTIKKLKSVGNMDLATQIEKETFLSNQIIMDAYLKELTFCPVYFFYSDYSDSVRHKNIRGIFLDTNLVVDPTIVCNQSFYLVAEYGGFYNSSLRILKEDSARHSMEQGNYVKDVPIIIKTRHFFQLHKPFPFIQTKAASPDQFQKNKKGILKDELIAYQHLKKISNNSKESSKMKNFRGYVYAFNNKLIDFYNANKDFTPPLETMQFVY